MLAFRRAAAINAVILNGDNMDGSAENKTLGKTNKVAIERAKIIGGIIGAVLFIGWRAYPSAINWWDRKGFEATVEKTLSQRGIATASDNPNSSVEEYGIGDFKGRKLPAVVVRTKFLQVDKIAGEKTPRCLLMYSLIDKEFDSYRNISMSECDEPKELADWKATVHFK